MKGARVGWWKAGILGAAALLAECALAAFQPVPEDCLEALGKTAGKSIPSGLVFVRGKCIPPPYVIERRGTALWINSHQVTGQVVDWNEFLRTQKNVVVGKTAVSAPESVVQPPPIAASAPAKAESVVPPSPSANELKNELDSLFDDEEPVVKAPTETTAAEKLASQIVAPPTVSPVLGNKGSVVTYSLNGDFKPNEASKKLLDQIEAGRLKFERVLRTGGFLFFGENYPRVMGNKQLLLAMLKFLPEAMKTAKTQTEFAQKMREAGLAHLYTNKTLCEELFNNRRDARMLQIRRDRLQMSKKWDKIVEEASDPLF